MGTRCRIAEKGEKEVMYEELVKRLRWAASYDERIVIQDAKDAADVIEELQFTIKGLKAEKVCAIVEEKGRTLLKIIPKWIPVTERLPEEEEVVLVWGGTSVYTAKRHNKYGGLMWWKLNSKQHYCNPTHWMPLPQPPEKEDIFHPNECEKEDGEA